MKKRTHPFPVKLVLDGYKSACREWKVKIKKEVPEAFTQGTHFTQGDKVTMSGSDYILAQVESSRMCLISLENGNRYTDPVEVSNVLSVTSSELLQMAGSCHITDLTVNGVRLTAKALANVEVSVAFIHEAYAAADTVMKRKIQDAAPELFRARKITPLTSVSLGTLASVLDHEGNEEARLLVGKGLAPDPQLENRCLVLTASSLKFMVSDDGLTVTIVKA